MLKLLAIMSGGALGASFRHLMFLLFQPLGGEVFPAGTMAANLTGSFLIGFLWSFFENTNLAHGWRLFIFTGFLGGFTTFSTFARETTQLFRAGQWKTGLIYLAASNLLGIFMVVAGYALTRRLQLSG